MLEDRVHGVLAAVHEIRDPGREVDRVEELEDELDRERVLLRGLDDDRVSARDRERQEPVRDHEGEVERRDRGEDADRLSDHVRVDPARDVFEIRALHERRDAGGDLDALDAAANLTGGVFRRLPVVERDEPGQIVLTLLELVLELEAGAGAFDWRRRAPAGERLPRCAYGRVDIGCGGQRDLYEHLAVRRIRDVEALLRLRVGPAAPHVVLHRPRSRLDRHLPPLSLGVAYRRHVSRSRRARPGTRHRLLRDQPRLPLGRRGRAFRQPAQ
jgi:hypothetical protein